MALMNIYMLSGMYKEAYELNEQQIKETLASTDNV